MNGLATIRYELPEERAVSLRVFNVMGQLVATLADGPRPAGFHAVAWDGLDDGGRRVASGIYYYRLDTGDFSATRRLLVIR
jgi:hypothetical protein